MLNDGDPLSLAEAFLLTLTRNPDAVALVVDDQSWTRRQLAELSARAVTRLTALGIRAGDRVVVQYNTHANDVALALAAASLGATFIPIPQRLGMREVNYLLERSDGRVFAHVGDNPPAGVNPPAGAKLMAIRSIGEEQPTYIDHPVQTGSDHIALIGVTSGSTGQPKGVMHGWEGVEWAARRMARLADLKDGESILVTGAGAGAPGFTIFTYTGLLMGATIVQTSKWNPVKLLSLAAKHNCVWSTMVPTMLQMLIDARPQALGDSKLDAMRCITVGGSFISPALIQAARNDLGIEVLRMYAMAECMCNASMLMTDTRRERETYDGRPGDGADIAAFDNERKKLPTGEVGELALRGPSLLKGYMADPTGKTSLMTEDGFFLSGDLGCVTPEGFVKVLGRKKDMIIRGGYNIDPSEVETLIQTHPAVSKIVIVGYPDKVFGEKACAVVECVPGKTLTLEDLVAYLVNEGMSKEKLPERLELRTALPLSPDGKILKALLRKEIGTNPALGAL